MPCYIQNKEQTVSFHRCWHWSQESILELGIKAPWPEVTSSEAKGQWDSLGRWREGGAVGETGSGEGSGMICVRPGFAKVSPAKPWDHHGFQPLPCRLSACLPAATQADISPYLLIAFPGYLRQHSHYLWAGGLLQVNVANKLPYPTHSVHFTLGGFVKLKSEGCQV